MKHLFYFLLLFSIVACTGKKSDLPAESAALIDRLLSQRFSPVIDVDDELLVRFREHIPLNIQDVSTDFQLNPKTAGTYKWLDDHTLTFKPEEPFEYDQSYSLTIPLNQLLDSIPDEGDALILTFKTRPLEVTLLSAEPHLFVEDDQVRITINGQIASNQYVDNQYIKDLLQVAGIEHSTETTWKHEENSRIHRFTITGLRQTSYEQQLKIQLKTGKHLTTPEAKKLIVTLSPANDFSLKDIYVQNPGRIITCIFTQPLNQRQNLDGLVKINDQNENLRLLIADNELQIFTEGFSEEQLTVHLDQAIRSFNDASLPKNYTQSVSLEPILPQLRIGSNGVLVPPVSAVTFPFEAINLDTVDIEIFKIYEQNVLQFMQDNTLSGSYNLVEVGKIVHKEKLAISNTATPINQWQSIAIDLGNYLRNDPGAIYQVRVGFQPTYIRVKCPEAIEDYRPTAEDESMMDYRYYDYHRRNDPCSPAYYNPDHFIKRNIIYSNLAAIIKRVANNAFYVASIKISDGYILSGADISFYNYQKILLGSVTTTELGTAEIQLTEKPSFAIAKHLEGTTYINLQDGAVNSISDFETSGTQSTNGINSFIYTERGVYRPGDTIHLHVMVDKGSVDLPDDYPSHISIKDPQGQLKFEKTTREHVSDIYTFSIPTDSRDKTGIWTATFTIGSSSSSTRIPVETIKPNRLRINLDLKERISYSDETSRVIGISSSWLHGAPADNLRAKIDAVWSSMTPQFSNFSSYKFTDPARQLNAGQITLFDGLLDQNGSAHFSLQLDHEARYPAMLRGNVTSRVFEKGGSFSENYATIEVSPFSHYTGVSVPENEWGYASVTIGDEATFQTVSLTEDGQVAANRKLTVGIYDIDWRWWYYRGERFRIYELNSDEHTQAVWKSEVTTGPNGVADVRFDASDLEYGRKLIRVCDPESGHCTGDFFYATGRSYSVAEEERNSLSRLHFSSDKTKYEVGDKVTLSIPSEKGTHILVSLEGGDNILTQEWIEGLEDVTPYTFKVSASMAPNIYAHVSLIQPYGQESNDLPIRMYGIIPILVNNPDSWRQPRIHLPSEIKPNESFTIGVSEENNQSMTYTLAIVDEGLLDLTNFKTPDPHGHFYAKQSLGVQTWDVYDDILYGLNSRTDKIISIGGDGSDVMDSGSKQAIRFKPVVFTAGPFTLSPRERRNHTFTMPDYVGSVRVMVIGREGDSYGHTEATIPVKAPLMLLPTLPRVLSMGEEIDLPVTLFAMQEDIREVTINVQASPLTSLAKSDKSLSFIQVGEQTTSFNVTIGEKTGIAEFDISASAGPYRAGKRLEVDVRNPSPIQTEVFSAVLEPGKSWSSTYQPFGITGTNNATVELSHLPPLKLASKLEFLINYPYGCIEQTTSAAFVQLYLPELTDYVAPPTIERNIKAGINRIVKMQHSNGGFKYWPTSRGEVHEWSSSYAGHFLIEAREKGYYVANKVINQWIDDQKRRANQFLIEPDQLPYRRHQVLLNQAYRLYTLSIAGAPNLSAMNLLRTHPDLPATARYLLGAAYARASKANLALDLIENVNTDVRPYRDMGYTLGSEVRDLALIAQSLIFLDRRTQAVQVVRKIMDQLNSSNWYSTQSIAFGLLAVGKLADNYKDSQIKATISSTITGEQKITYDKPVFTMSFNPDEHTDKKLSITNDGSKTLFLSFQLEGQRSPEDLLRQPASNRHIQLTVTYKDLNGKVIDITELEQGMDFLAEIEIVNRNTRGTNIEQMVLTQIVPSGWEIRTGRLNTDIGFSEDSYEYRDVRDDRVHTFFDLQSRKKFLIRFNAAYAGKYYLPPVKAEAMYDKDVFSFTKSKKVTVNRFGVN